MKVHGDTFPMALFLFYAFTLSKEERQKGRRRESLIFRCCTALALTPFLPQLLPVQGPFLFRYELSEVLEQKRGRRLVVFDCECDLRAGRFEDLQGFIVGHARQRGVIHWMIEFLY